MTELNAILAMNQKGVIGRNNQLPWYIPEDLHYFKKTTRNQIVIMGRKTFDSLPNGPLPNRINVVLTKNPAKYRQLENMFQDQLYFVTFENLENTLQEIQQNNEIQKSDKKQIFVIGGSQIYEKFYPLYTKIYLTIVDDAYSDTTDVYNSFNEVSMINQNYVEIHREPMKKSRVNDQKYEHVIFEKRERS
jgi:dihydrofolate reductase